MKDDSKCKVKGKQSGVWRKKVGKKYFVKKIGNFLLKYFFEKKKTSSRPIPCTWQYMYVMRLEVGAFVDIKIKIKNNEKLKIKGWVGLK